MSEMSENDVVASEARSSLGRLRGEIGASAVEYALMVAAIATVVAAAAFALGTTTDSSLSNTCQSIATAGGGTASSC